MTEISTEFKKEALRQKQALPLEGKIILTEQRIHEWYNHWGGQVYISFSGGKDSTVLRDIVKRLYPDVPAVFVDTGLEYPEVRKFATERADVVLRPKMRFDEVIKTYGYPVVSKRVASYASTARRRPDSQRARWLKGIDKTKFVSAKWAFLIDAPFAVSARCCDIMKKKPMKLYQKETQRMPIIGTMACEGANRENAYLLTGCNAFSGRQPASHPLSVWLEQDILQYIKRNGLEIAPVYGEIVERDQLRGQTRLFDGEYSELVTTGAKRTGCMFCMFGAQCEKSPNRFQKMKETHPRQYAYCMKSVEDGGLGLRDVLDYIGVPYE